MSVWWILCPLKRCEFFLEKKNQKDFIHLFLFLLSIKGGHVRVVDRGTCLSLVSVLNCHLVTERKFKI